MRPPIVGGGYGGGGYGGEDFSFNPPPLHGGWRANASSRRGTLPGCPGVLDPHHLTFSFVFNGLSRGLRLTKGSLVGEVRITHKCLINHALVGR